MFGQNPVSKPRPAEAGFLVHSIFYTIQGEGPWAGKPTIFVRFAGCNLQCAFCDTEFTQGSTEWSLEHLALHLAHMARRHRCFKFVLTGGEPMLQRIDLLMLYMRQHCYGCAFQIETAGTIWPGGVGGPMSEVMRLEVGGPESLGRVQYERFCTLVCSPKTPKVHPAVDYHCHHWKYIVIANEIEPSTGWPTRGPNGPRLFVPDPENGPDGLRREGDTFYMQPCDVPDDAEATAANMRLAAALALRHGRMLSIQIHKIAGLE